MEGRSEILMTNPLEQVSHLPKRVVKNDVHVSTMHLRDEVPPILNLAVMVVEKGEIKGAKPIAAPRHVDKWCSGQIYGLQISAVSQGRDGEFTLIPIP
jgi:hypothetical protein